jgi:hypothetical protein
MKDGHLHMEKRGCGGLSDIQQSFFSAGIALHVRRCK